MFDEKIPSIDKLYKDITVIETWDIEDFTELKQYENLRALCIPNIITSNISLLTLKNALSELEYFKRLETGVGKEVDFELLGNLNTIEFLEVQAEYEENLEELIKYDCDEIDFYIDKSFDIASIKDWKQLKYLSIKFPKVENLQYISLLENLEVLRLYDNSFEDISWIANMENLKYIEIIQSTNFSELSINTIHKIEARVPNTKIISIFSENDEKLEYQEFISGIRCQLE